MVSISTNSANIVTNKSTVNIMKNFLDIPATLKKLPLWGEKVSDDLIDFEWPSPNIFAAMDPDVSIQSIEFKTNCQDCSSLSSVKLNLSNG